jgi:phosphorylated CTD-interacting factor 1
MTDFMYYASAEVHTLPPRKRLAAIMRDVAHSPTDLGSKKGRIAGEAYVRLALRDPRLLGKALVISERSTAVSEGLTTSGRSGSYDDTTTAGTGDDAKKKKRTHSNASASDLTTQTTDKKKKKTSHARSSDDDDDSTRGEPKELSDEALALRLHMEMNASPRMSRGSRQSSQILKPQALFD